MKKLLSIIMVALMATSAFAFVPLTNSQLNIGSYQRGATRGMFYNELDIVSAAPVELLDFSGNVLYTNWGNIRNFNDIANYGAALDWDTTVGQVADVNYFTFGVTGNPLSYAGIEDSRSGIVYQNYGGKTVYKDLDKGKTAANDSEGEWSNDTYTLEYATTTPTVGKNVNTTASDLKYNLNNTYTQWNVGTSYKLMDKISLGLSLERETNTNIMTTEGSMSYSEKYLTATGAINDNKIRTATENNSYSVTFPSEEYDKESSNETIILPQARFNITDDLNIDVAIGASIRNDIGIDNWIGAGKNEKTVVTVTAKESVLIGTAPAATPPSAIDGRNQYFNTGTAIVGKNNPTLPLDYDGTLGALPALATGIFTTAPGVDNSGISNFEDDREGTAPLVRIEAKKKFEKVDLTGVVNFSSLSRDVDASLTEREYVENSVVFITSGAVAQNWTHTTPSTDRFIEKDYTKTTSLSGTAKNGNLDLGAKISMKALEGVRLSFGGFLRRATVKTEGDTTISSRELCSYDDGRVSTAAYTEGGVDIGGTLTSSGTITSGNSDLFIPTLKPGAIAASAEGASRTFYGMNNGSGEGSWLQTISKTGTYEKEEITLIYSVPVGIEIPLSKKWTFRAGTEYVMTKKETTEETTTTVTYTQTTATPGNGESAQPTDTVANPQPSSTKSVYTEEDHDVYYTYGVQFDATPSLTIACNAFLDTATAASAGNSNASIFDLDTYKSLSLSAAFKF